MAQVIKNQQMQQQPAPPATTPFQTPTQAGAPGSNPLLPSAPPLPPPPGAPNISAQDDPTLGAIDKQYEQYANDLQNNTGRILNQATSATRDAFAGLRQQTGEDYAMRGVGGGDALREVDSETGRAIAGQHAQVARNREEQMLGALNARNSARQGAISATQGEKRIGLDAYGLHNQAMSDYNHLNAQNASTAFDQLLAMMKAQRESNNPLANPYGTGGQSGMQGSGAVMGGMGGPSGMPTNYPPPRPSPFAAPVRR